MMERIVGNPYSFPSDATDTNDRFSILFKSSSISTDLSSKDYNGNIFTVLLEITRV
ncbi:MAG: hypothetical protein ABFC90_04815 [Bacteroidales bacterium]|nr:hypothetical protein [Bacteroidales bacterium]MDD2613088.1 hypothetical protein [Bacteroidales bacterium]MDD4713109.1 hypothetical protein [Bacteroidales bacterium]